MQKTYYKFINKHVTLILIYVVQRQTVMLRLKRLMNPVVRYYLNLASAVTIRLIVVIAITVAFVLMPGQDHCN